MNVFRSNIFDIFIIFVDKGVYMSVCGIYVMCKVKVGDFWFVVIVEKYRFCVDILM